MDDRHLQRTGDDVLMVPRHEFRQHTDRRIGRRIGRRSRRNSIRWLLVVTLFGMAQWGTQPTSFAQDVGPKSTANKVSPVLRHAVFFKFKETSTADDIAQIVEAFRELPKKIDSITNFEWGTNNSPEGLDGGFTHCFLLTFADEQGRADYLPHPDHKAFGALLRPHLDHVFVVDYWADGVDSTLDRPLRHAVFFKFKEDASADDVEAVEAAFAALPAKIPAIRAFEWGKNNSPETHDDGFTHAFLVTFASDAGRDQYLPHPAHQAFVDVLRPVLDKVRVLDFWGGP